MKRKLIVFLAAFCAVPAFAHPLPPLPEPAFADTEVTAHHPLAIPQANVNGLNLEIAFVGTASNNVEIALGRDEDGDSYLTPPPPIRVIRVIRGESSAACAWRAEYGILQAVKI